MSKSGVQQTFIILILIATIFFAGCTQSPAAMQPAHATGLKPPPANVSADLQKIIANGAEKSGFSGVQAEIATPRWTWNSAAGNSSRSPAVKAEPGMRFIVASVTKVFTSVAIQKLAEEGKLSLDDPIDRWLPPDVSQRIPNSSFITVRQLLDHTSGIADYDEADIVFREHARPDIPIPYQDGMDASLAAGPLYLPGAGFTYSNVNYILLTLIIDKAANDPYEDYVTRNIFVPAGMNATFIHHTNHIPGPHMEAQEVSQNGTVVDFSDQYIQFDRGAGDIVSTTADLNRFHRALITGKLIGPASLAAMKKTSPQSNRDIPPNQFGGMATGYGLGYFVQTNATENLTLQGHSGGYPGSTTIMFYWPEQDTYIAMNANSDVNAVRVYPDIIFPIIRYLKTAG
jgi:D-alanyl-D-alanine carboxypeptidase